MTYILRITDDTDTVDLVSDDYSLNTGGWAPTVADDGDVPESLSINILNGQPGGGTAQGSRYRFAQNKAKLQRLLRNAQRFGQHDPTVAPVRLEWAPQHGDPARLWASLIVGWDESAFLPATTNDADGQLTEKLEGVTLSIVRRAPWLQTSFIYPNLLDGTATMLGWTGSPNGAAPDSFTGHYGGLIYLRMAMDGFGDQVCYSDDALSIVSGQTYRVALSYGSSDCNPDVSISLIDSAVTTARSNIVTLPTAKNQAIGAGRLLVADLVATATDATARLFLAFAPEDPAETMDIAEALIWHVTAGAPDFQVWHPQYAELTETDTSAAAAPSVLELLFDGALNTPAPVTLALTGFDTLDTPILNPGYIVVTDQEGSDGLIVYDWDVVGNPAYSLENDTDDGYDPKPLGGFVQRFTPAGTAQISPGPLDGVFPLWKGRIQILAAVHNRSTTHTFWKQAVMSQSNLAIPGREVAIPPGSGRQIISLGEVASVDGLDTLELFDRASAAAAAGTDVLDTDYIVLVRMTDQTAILPYGLMRADDYMSGDDYALWIQPRALESVAPRLILDNPPPFASGDVVQATYHRADLDLRMAGRRLSVAWLATFTDGANKNYWRHIDESGGGVIQVGATATRLPGTDVPL